MRNRGRKKPCRQDERYDYPPKKQQKSKTSTEKNETPELDAAGTGAARQTPPRDPIPMARKEVHSQEQEVVPDAMTVDCLAKTWKT